MQLAEGDLGLQLNHFKSEIICRDHSTRTAMVRVFPDLCPVSPEQATFLGSPIGGEEGVDKFISERTRTLEIIGGRLWHIHDDAFCLLHHAFALPKYCIY